MIGNRKPVCEIDERLADLRLKKDDDGEADINDRVPEYEFKRRKILIDRDPIKQAEQYQSDHCRHGSRAAEQFQNYIDKNKNERDVDDIPQRIYRYVVG
jgi:hypothetical protein